ncbi:hypothetical protein AHMF7616_05225 [Adhaeribacter pallidiroseus]|uniref:HTH cro/C1-type domain-containing protein n=2 Tax=Adhaeribacter pallidiroseus TaxID=2072847 RepID=A0A369Q1I8_9BACT|nr:hypothetical protein AHMF7616_05225 [Adhaeribacter pallidiroseus]
MEYTEAMSRIDTILEQNPEPGTDLFDELELLSTLVHAYEEIHYSIDTPDPIEAIKYVMEEKGLKNKDLEPFIGPKSRVSEILNRKRYFTLEQINKLHKALNIPLEVFINDKILEATSL